MEVLDIKEALTYLKQGFVLIIIDNKAIVRYRNEKYHVRHDQWHTPLSEENFVSLFWESQFVLYETKDEAISSEKDQEYYQWRGKYL